jgi:2,4-dienoyl-CoA reductase-like NADH-dependent reductase (Old Yellow Enzyme family)
MVMIESFFIKNRSRLKRATNPKGNVQVDAAHLGDPGNIAVDSSLPEATSLAAFRAWAATCSSNGTKAVVQLCHPGRQIAFRKDKMAPSAIPMDFGTALMPRFLNSLVFGTPRAMTAGEIRAVISQFAAAARLMAAVGFSGIQLHAAHGYLLAQFLSARSNARTDAYGGSAVARARIVVEIIHAVRDVVPPGFCVGVKLNSVDVGRATDLGDRLEQVRAVVAAGIDFLEVSGGTFEDPIFSTGPAPEEELPREQKKQSTIAREAFFLDFARAVRETVADVPLVVTGGFRTRRGMEAALANGSCDLIGLARPAIMDPLLPRSVLLNYDIPTDEAGIRVKRIPPSPLVKMLGVKLLGVGAENVSCDSPSLTEDQDALPTCTPFFTQTLISLPYRIGIRGECTTSAHPRVH